MIYEIGEVATYYPPQNDGENLHWPVKVTGMSPSRRWRIEFERDGKTLRRDVSDKSLARQCELIESTV